MLFAALPLPRRRLAFAACTILSLSAGTMFAFGAASAQTPTPVAPNVLSAAATGKGTVLSVLTVGGGPSKKYNQVAIESNVRYVDNLLPANASRRVLFADGSTTTPEVLYHDAPSDTKISDAEAAFGYLFEARTAPPDKFRPVRLRSVSGPSTKSTVSSEITRLASSDTGTALLYFTGHGSPAKSGDLDNNVYDLWNNDRISVRELAGEIHKIPARRPVVLVMVQCFGGAFGNVLFENGDPGAKAVDRPLCGFFATTRERVAAGCTPEVNEADYHDFTSSFFAALSGKTRLGQPVPPPDYDKNGIVTMDEAFAYAQITEPSVDVPVCTSDVFLRRFVPLKDDAEVAALPYSRVRGMASPAQQAALDGISKALQAGGETRFQTALADVRVRADGMSGGGGGHAAAHDASVGPDPSLTQTLSEWRTRLRSRFPGLRSRASEASFADARRKAINALEAAPRDTQAVLAAGDKLNNAFETEYQDELKGARWLRLMRVAKTVVLENRLRKSGNAALIARFDALRKLEKTNPLL